MAVKSEHLHAHTLTRGSGARNHCVLFAIQLELAFCSVPLISCFSPCYPLRCRIDSVSSCRYMCGDFWMYNVSGPYSCPQDCSGHGVCEWGFCMCDKGFKGVDCSVCRYQQSVSLLYSRKLCERPLCITSDNHLETQHRP